MNVEQLTSSLSTEFGGIPKTLLRGLARRVLAEVADEIYRALDKHGDFVVFERRVLFFTLRVRLRDVRGPLMFILGKVISPEGA